MDLLPSDTLFSIFSYLSLKQICSLCSLNRKFNEVGTHERLWRYVSLDKDNKIGDEVFIRVMIPKMTKYTEYLSISKCRNLTATSFQALQTLTKVSILY